MEDSNSHGQERAGRSYMERILNSLHAGEDLPESSNLFEEPSVQRGQVPAVYTGTNICENFSQTGYSNEQLITSETMWPEYSDFSRLVEESLELPMMSYDRSMDTNIIPSSVTACPSFSSFPDPLADTIKHGMLQFQSAAGSTSSVGEDLIKVGDQEQLSWISFDELNSTTMMSQAEAHGSNHEPFPSEISSLVAASCDHKVGEKIAASTYSRNSRPDFAASHRFQTVTRRGSSIKRPGTPNSDQSLSSSVSDGSADVVTNNSSTILQQHQHLQLVGCDVAESRGTTSPPDCPGRLEEEGAHEDHNTSKSTDQVCKTKKLQPILRPRKKGQMKRVRQPKHCIKTRTDVEIMDDNFKWRKYGQKAVKNSPYPRNYYRCSTQNCPVRKRVERCANDPGFVLTTYEGTHTHQSPAFARVPIGAYFGGFSHPYMDPFSQAAYIPNLGAYIPNLGTSASLLPLFSYRDPTCNPNYIGSLSGSMLSHNLEALNSYNSRIGTIMPSSSVACISNSQQFGDGQLIDPSLLAKLQHMEHNLRSDTQSSVLGTMSELLSLQTGPMIDFSAHPLMGSQPMLQDESPQVWETARSTQGQIAELAALQQFDDNKFIEAKLWSSGQDFVGSRDIGLLRPPTTVRSLEAACRSDEGILEDMIRPALPRYGLR